MALYDTRVSDDLLTYTFHLRADGRWSAWADRGRRALS